MRFLPKLPLCVPKRQIIQRTATVVAIESIAEDAPELSVESQATTSSEITPEKLDQTNIDSLFGDATVSSAPEAKVGFAAGFEQRLVPF